MADLYERIIVTSVESMGGNLFRVHVCCEGRQWFPRSDAPLDTTRDHVVLVKDKFARLFGKGKQFQGYLFGTAEIRKWAESHGGRFVIDDFVKGMIAIIGPTAAANGLGE